MYQTPHLTTIRYCYSLTLQKVVVMFSQLSCTKMVEINVMLQLSHWVAAMIHLTEHLPRDQLQNLLYSFATWEQHVCRHIWIFCETVYFQHRRVRRKQIMKTSCWHLIVCLLGRGGLSMSRHSVSLLSQFLFFKQR